MRGFKEIREIKTEEKITDKQQKSIPNICKLKPETDMTVEEARAFIDSLFTQKR